MSNLQIAFIVAAVLIGIVALVIRFAGKWIDSLFDYDIDDVLAEADAEVANRLRVGDGGEKVGY